MLEALIRTKDGDMSNKRAGDVICIKLQEFSGWSYFERSVHKVVEWEDQELEKTMREELSKTGLSPIATTPYMEIDSDSSLVKTRSSMYFDFNDNKPTTKTPEQVSSEFEMNKKFWRITKHG